MFLGLNFTSTGKITPSSGSHFSSHSHLNLVPVVRDIIEMFSTRSLNLVPLHCEFIYFVYQCTPISGYTCLLKLYLHKSSILVDGSLTATNIFVNCWQTANQSLRSVFLPFHSLCFCCFILFISARVTENLSIFASILLGRNLLTH